VCRGVCHVPQARSQTMERRAYGRLARGLSSWCCVAGYSDATSDECGPNSACCCRADQWPARSAAFVGPLAAAAGVSIYAAAPANAATLAPPPHAAQATATTMSPPSMRCTFT